MIFINIEYRNGEKNMTGGSESKTPNLCQCDVFTNTYTISLQTFLHYSGLRLWIAFFCCFHEILFSHFNAFTHSHTLSLIRTLFFIFSFCKFMLDRLISIFFHSSDIYFYYKLSSILISACLDPATTGQIT